MDTDTKKTPKIKISEFMEGIQSRFSRGKQNGGEQNQETHLGKGPLRFSNFKLYLFHLTSKALFGI